MSRHDPLADSDERGSVLLVVLLIMFLSIIIVTVTTGAVAQTSLSRDLTFRNDYLQGALAGNQAALGQIRAATSDGAVQVTQLPCAAVIGQTNTASSTSYRATIQYYAKTFAGMASTVGCTQGLGPTVGAGQYLASAVITSCAPLGSCPTNSNPGTSALWRRVVSTYIFKTTDANIPGGAILSYDNRECLLADFTDPNNPVLDVTTSCAAGNPSAALEDFQYTPNSNLEIQVDGSDYCVQDPEDLPSPPTDPTLPLGSCTTSAVDQWGVNDGAGIQGVSATASPAGQPNSWCLENTLGEDGGFTAQPPHTAAASVQVCSGSYSNFDTWQMAPSVGAGAAEPDGNQLFGTTNQMVNFQEFGRCIDVTNQDVHYQFLIDYTCKQFPDVADYPIWNQRWCFAQLGSTGLTRYGTLYTPYPGTSCTDTTSAYCLTDPGGTATQSLQNFVTVTQCTNPYTANPASDLVWTAWGQQGGSLHDFTWTDSQGYCLEANPNPFGLPAGNNDLWSVIQVDSCNGSYKQKWNAPANTGNSLLTNTHEQTGDTGTIVP